MAHQIFINVDQKELRKALVAGLNQPNAPVRPPDLVVGSETDIEVFLIDGDGNYDVRSGLGGYTLKIGAGPRGGVPNGGTLTLGDGTDNTAAIDFNAPASTLQSALNKLNTNTGPFGDTVTVKKISTGQYLVTFDSVGAQTLISGSGVNLTPESTVVVTEVTAGDGSTQEVQLVQFIRQPAVYLELPTQITNGWSGTLSADNLRVIELLAGKGEINTDFEVELQQGSSTPDVLAQSEIRIAGETINPASITGTIITPAEAVRDGDSLLAHVRLDILGLTGGNVTDLDGIVTTSLATGRLYIIAAPLGPTVPSQFWVLQAGTDAEDPANGIVRPDDYAASTNEKIWKALSAL
jgi:hypothetical protein